MRCFKPADEAMKIVLKSHKKSVAAKTFKKPFIAVSLETSSSYLLGYASDKLSQLSLTVTITVTVKEIRNSDLDHLNTVDHV